MVLRIARLHRRSFAALWYAATALVPSVLFGLPLLLLTLFDTGQRDPAAIHAVVVTWVLPAASAALAGFAIGSSRASTALPWVLRGALVALFATLVFGFVPPMFEPAAAGGSEFSPEQQAERSRLASQGVAVLLAVPMAVFGGLSGRLLRTIDRRARAHPT